MTSSTITLAAGLTGPYRVRDIRKVRGDLPASLGEGMPPRLALYEGHVSVLPGGTHFAVRGTKSSARYATRAELDAVHALESTAEQAFGCVIALRKNEAWWALAQDERRAIFEARSHHIAASLPFAPGIAKTLYQARELGEFYDFVTWFSFAQANEALFDELLANMRASEEWTFVDRELEIRFAREP